MCEGQGQRSHWPGSNEGPKERQVGSHERQVASLEWQICDEAIFRVDDLKKNQQNSSLFLSPRV